MAHLFLDPVLFPALRPLSSALPYSFPHRGTIGAALAAAGCAPCTAACAVQPATVAADWSIFQLGNMNDILRTGGGFTQ